MSAIRTLLRWDIILLYRNSLFQISGIITLVYIGIFYLLRPLGNLYIPLIVLIFNDPVIICFMFSGVLWLFDKNQNTMQALSVLPLPRINYLISKTMALSLLAMILSILMTIAAVGFDFNIFHLSVSVFLSSVMFCALGFTIGSVSKNFLAFIMKSLPVFIASAVPFLLLFDFINIYWLIPFPTLGSVMILQSAFVEKSLSFVLAGYVSLLVWVAVILKICINTTLKRIQ